MFAQPIVANTRLVALDVCRADFVSASGMMRNCSFRLVVHAIPLACFTLLAGCQLSAPIHTWTPPEFQSAVGKTVIVPKIVGPRDLAESIHQKLLDAAPDDQGRSIRLIAPSTLRQYVDSAADNQNAGDISLVSYTQYDESDLALASTARRQGIEFILRGEILADRGQRAISEAGERLTVSWRLMPILQDGQAGSEGVPMGKPVVVELDSALERYPDLKLGIDQDAMIQTALVRDTLPLFTPSVQRDQIQLEIPYLVLGSRPIRRGNAMALAGRWGDAESIWREVHERYPFSSVAVHNLAIACVAKQSFSEARELSRKAVRMKPTQLHQRTLVWVEQTQRAYHQAFGLADPPEGWVVTR